MKRLLGIAVIVTTILQGLFLSFFFRAHFILEPVENPDSFYPGYTEWIWFHALLVVFAAPPIAAGIILSRGKAK